LFHDKVRVVFDGVDTNLWRPLANLPRRIGQWPLPEGQRIVTYVARGMESIRGFDIFMRTAKRLCERRSDVFFVVVGEDRVCYGGDAEATGQASFKQWVLGRDTYDLSRFLFTGLLPTVELVKLFSLSDLHVYLTVPFVLSWSLMDALACGTTVLASQTAPVREMIRHNHNGLLADFFDVDALVDTSCRVLDAPGDFKQLGRAGVEMVRQHYSLDVCLPQMLQLYQDAVAAYRVR
jgi:glycosyltransferase involved in cell wall biosynthesis